MLRKTAATKKLTAVKQAAAKPGSSKATPAKKSAIKKSAASKSTLSKSKVKKVRPARKPGLVVKSRSKRAAVVQFAVTPSAGALAVLLEEAERGLLRAGKALHDEVAPLLAAAGLRLQLLRMDHPEAADPVNSVLATIDHAMERVRSLSQQLNPSPVYAIPARPGSVPRREPDA